MQSLANYIKLKSTCQKDGWQKALRLQAIGSILFISLLLFSLDGFGQITITAARTWSSLSPKPTISDDIVINGNGALTVDVSDAVARNITVGTSGGSKGQLILNPGSGLTCATIGTGGGGTFTLGNGSLTLTGVFTAPSGMTSVGNLTLTSGAKLTVEQNFLISGGFTIANDAEWIQTGSRSLGIGGNLTNNGIFTPSTGLHTFSGTNTFIQGLAGLSIPNVAINGSVTNGNTLTVSTALSGVGTLINDVNAVLNVGGSSSITNLTAAASGNTVNYTGGNQTVKATTYFNLNFSGVSNSTKTISGQSTVNGTLSVESGIVVALDANLTHTVANLTLGGYGKNTGLWGGSNSGLNTLLADQFIDGTFFAPGSSNANRGRLSVTNDTRPQLTVASINRTKVYGNTISTSLGTDFTVTGLISSDAVSSVTISYSGTPAGNLSTAAVGTYTTTISALTLSPGSAANYNITYLSTGTLTITPAPLTITANNASRVYGTLLNNASGSTAFTSNGLVGSESIASISLSYPTAVGGGNTVNDPVGTYTNTVMPSALVAGSGFVESNYSITYVPGSIIVTPKAITVSSSSFSIVTKPYDGTTAATIGGTPQYIGLVGSDVIAVNGALTATFADANAGVGKTVTVSGFITPNANYTIVGSMTVTGAITQAPLTLIANDVYKATGTLLAASVAGQTNFNATGLVGNENILSVTLNFGNGRLAADPSGQYIGSVVPGLPVGDAGFFASNYLITTVAADLYVEGLLYSRQSGDWHSTTTWSATSGGASCNCVPGENDVVHIERGFTVTVTQNARAYSVLLAGPTNPQVGSLTVNSPAVLTVTNEVSLETFKSSGNVTGNISGTGTINTAHLNLGSSAIRSVGQAINTINVNIANLNITGDISLYSNYQGSNKGAIAVLNIGTNSNVVSNKLILYSNVNIISSTENLMRLSMASNSTLTLAGGPIPIEIKTNNNIIPQNATISLDPTSTIKFNGSAISQVIPTSISNSGSGGTTTPLPIVYGSLAINNTHQDGASLAAALTTQNLQGDLEVEGGLIKNGGFNITGSSGKIFRVRSGATFEMSGTSSFPSGYSQYVFENNSTTKYLQTNNQVISVQQFGHLHLMPAANGVTYTFGAGSTGIQNNLLIGNGVNTGTVVTALTNSTVLDVDGSLTIAAHASLLANSSNTMTVGGNWANNGTFDHRNGTVLLDGGDATLGGASVNTFYNLVINAKSGGTATKTLTSNTFIKNLLTFTEGYFVTSATNKITIDNGASTTGAHDKSYVVGPVMKIGTNGVVGPNGFSFSFPTGQPNEKLYDPVIIRFPISSDNIAFTVTHYHGAPIPDADRKDNNVKKLSKFFEEYWDIHNDEPGTNSTYTNVLAAMGVDVTVHVHEKLKPNIPPNLYMIHRRPSDLTWEVPNMLQQSVSAAPYLGNDATAIFLPGQKDFSTYSTAGGLSSLPVTLVDFKARVTPDNKIALGWTTASESVNKGFRIQRQAASNGMGGKFEQIGFVISKAKDGNSQSLLNYNFLDQMPVRGTAFYRLVQEDLDGTLTNSEVRLVNLSECESVVLMFPNPSTGSFTVSRTPNGKKISIAVYDLAGRIVKQVFNIAEPIYRMDLDQPGVYNVKLMCLETGEQSIQRIVIQK